MRSKRILWVAVLGTGWAAMATAQSAAPAQPATRPAGETVDQTMDRLLTSGRPSGRALPPPPAGPTLDASSGRAAVVPGAPAVPLIREGTYLPPRVGRLNHTADGQQAVLTFETDGKTLRDPPMIILPNLKLTGMEAVQFGQNRDVRFRVAGRVTEYKGRNYILLDMATAIPDVDTQF